MACLVDLSCVSENTKERERLIQEAWQIAGGAEKRVWMERHSADEGGTGDGML